MNETKNINQYKIIRPGLLICVCEKSDETGDWDAISSIRSIDKINGKLAKEMTDDELITEWLSNPGNWSL